MGTRETQRRAWREAVARADRALCDAIAAFNRTPAGDEDASEAAKYRFYDAWEAFDLAIAAPKPWTRPAKADLGKLHKLLNAPLAFGIRFPAGSGWVPVVKRIKPKIRARLRRKRRAAQRRRRYAVSR